MATREGIPRWKIMLGGSKNCGRFKLFPDEKEMAKEIAVSFILGRCMVNGKEYHLDLWNLSPKKKYRFLIKNYCNGASGALLFFDTSNMDSFNELSFWIDLFTDLSYSSARYLIGILKNEAIQQINDNDVDGMIRKNGLNDIFYLSIPDKDNTFAIIAKSLIKTFNPSLEIKEFSMEILNFSQVNQE